LNVNAPRQWAKRESAQSRADKGGENLKPRVSSTIEDRELRMLCFEWYWTLYPVETNMAVRSRTFLTACFGFLSVLPVLGPTNARYGLYFAATPAAARQVRDHAWPDPPVEKLMVGTPQWHRGSGLVYGTMALTNENAYPVKNVTIGCDFFDEWGKPIGTKATLIRRVVGPGRTTLSGVYFTLIFDNRVLSNAQAGACRIISAKRFQGRPAPTS
jgi:hypothetical protein